MTTDACNIIEGLQQIIKANITGINQVVRKYVKDGELHMFTGIRPTLALDQYPSLEFEATTGTMEWLTTSAQWCEYTIDCVLTVNCGSCMEQGMNYIVALAKAITTVYNWPVNMTWTVPHENQYSGDESDSFVPVKCEYSSIDRVDYMAVKGYAVRVARWSIPCRVVEPFPEPVGMGPQRVNWRKL
ncbi:MAG: hypothetical protein J6Y62_00805 [Clostridia bacterium]|nr:hypothetical protein [Clostridia bacterium]